MEGKLNAHPLWAEEYWKIKTFFEKDSTVVVGDVVKVNNEHYCVIKTNDPKKTLYLAELIKTKELEVTVEDGLSNDEKMAYLCKDNPIFSRLVEVTDPETGYVKFSAVEFQPECLHWYSDDFFSPTGHTAILPYQLAKELFHGNRINFQTNLTDEFNSNF